MESKKSKKSIARNIIGGFFIFLGFIGMFSSGVLSGIFMMLFGISLLPIVYEKTKLNKYKYIQIILPIIMIIIFGMSTSNTTIETNSDTNRILTNEIEEEKNIEITNLQFDESSIEMDLKETKDITIKVLPLGSNVENLECYTSNNQIATLEKSKNENNEKDIIFKINPITEGECEVYIKATNGIESNKIKLKIVDNDRIEKEKKEAEEQAQKEAEQKRAEEEKAKQEESTKKSQQTTTKKSTSNSQTTSNTDNSRTVYRTPTGKRYHYDPDCGGKNSYSTTLNAAKSSGLTPCQKCAK